MKTIALTGKHGRGKFAIVDDEDYAIVSDRPWYVSTQGYAVGRSGYMHRVIMGLKKGDPLQVDHLNHDRIDNRRVSNLRVIPAVANTQNMWRRGGTSNYRGVHWSKRSQMWAAQVSKDGRGIHLGHFSDELEAARAAQSVRLELMPYTVERVIL